VATFCDEKRNHLLPKQRRNFCSRQLQLSVLPLHSAMFPQSLSPSLSSLSFSLSLFLSSTSAIVRIYHPYATFSLLRIECREPAALHPTPSFWPTSANPRNTWDGKDRGWGRGSGLESTDSRRRGRDGGSDRRGRTPRKLHTRLRSTEE